MGIYGTAWRAVRRDPWFFVGLVALWTAFGLSDMAEHRQRIIDFMLSSLTSWALYRNILLGQRMTESLGRPAGRGDTIWGFMGVSVLFAVAGLVVEAVLRITLRDAWEQDVTGVRLLVSLAPGLAAAVLFIPFGTALPAAATGDAFSPRLTLARARRTGWMVVRGLAAGPFLFVLAALLALSGAFLWAVLLTGGDLAALREARWLVRLAAFALGSASMLVVSTLAAAVLCRAYREVAPPEIAALLIPETASRQGAPAQTPA